MSDQMPASLPLSSMWESKQAAPWDLATLMYIGGASPDRKSAARRLAAGELTESSPGRPALIAMLHEAMDTQLVGGGSPYTAKTTLGRLFRFVRWADDQHVPLNKDSVGDAVRQWAMHLEGRARLREIALTTAYAMVSDVCSLLDSAFEESAGTHLRSTNIVAPGAAGRPLGRTSDRQSLEETFAFGHMLASIATGLTIEAVKGPLPVIIRLADGRTIELWAMLRKVAQTNPQAPSREKNRKHLELRSQRDDLGQRYSLINARVEAELLIFIAQTGMNLQQAANLRMGAFSYQSGHNGYSVRRVYKGRRKGEVEFEIFRTYRGHFESYLRWREQIFPSDKDELLFKFMPRPGLDRSGTRQFSFVTQQAKLLDIPFCGPRRLRRTRINWIDRRTGDPQITAEMAQHSVATLDAVYAEPNHQVAVREITKFHRDPFAGIPAVFPGNCNGKEPKATSGALGVPGPDCISAPGCLFCDHHSDIDSFDHVWSLATYRQLKKLEIARHRRRLATEEVHPARLIIRKIDDRLASFQAVDFERQRWVAEAQARIEESYFHPHWAWLVSRAEVI